MKFCLVSVLCLALAYPAWSEGPAFDPAVQPFVGTWKFDYKFKKKPIPLRMVIAEREGQLAVRYEWPTEDTVYTSDWDGRCELKLRLNVKEIHEPVFSIDAERQRIGIAERIRYKGNDKGTGLQIKGYYALSDEAKTLTRHCESVIRDKKKLTCPGGFEYQRVSESTEWQSRRDWLKSRP
jgi:hypothetical protein